MSEPLITEVLDRSADLRRAGVSHHARIALVALAWRASDDRRGEIELNYLEHVLDVDPAGALDELAQHGLLFGGGVVRVLHYALAPVDTWLSEKGVTGTWRDDS